MLTTAQKQIPYDINAVLRLLGHQIPIAVTRQEGSDYVAPLNSQVTTSLPATNHAPGQDLPIAYDWRKVLNSQDKKTIIQPSVPQLGCGFCYTIGCVQCLSDRLTIASGKLCPFLSGTFVMSCGSSSSSVSSSVSTPPTTSMLLQGRQVVSDNQQAAAQGPPQATPSQIGNGCAGGDAKSVCIFLENAGTTSFSCAGFSWCTQSSPCYSGLGTSNELNNLLPPCANFANNRCSECISGTCHDVSGSVIHDTWKASSGSTRYLSTNDIKQTAYNMQHEIFIKGPIIGTLRVPEDFILVSTPANKFPGATFFAQTKGVYINIPGVDMYDTGALSTTDASVAPVLVSDSFAGNHTIGIVGYGVEYQVPIKSLPAPIDVPYWIVRNSWSSNWGQDQGYVKVAITQPQNKINTALGLDVPVALNIGELTVNIGGAYALDPASESIQQLQNSAHPSVTDVIDTNATPSPALRARTVRGTLRAPQEQSSWLWVLAAVVIGVIIVVLIAYK